jgi:hypothetical protein
MAKATDSKDSNADLPNLTRREAFYLRHNVQSPLNKNRCISPTHRRSSCIMLRGICRHEASSFIKNAQENCWWTRLSPYLASIVDRNYTAQQQVIEFCFRV